MCLFKMLFYRNLINVDAVRVQLPSIYKYLQQLQAEICVSEQIYDLYPPSCPLWGHRHVYWVQIVDLFGHEDLDLHVTRKEMVKSSIYKQEGLYAISLHHCEIAF